MPLDAGPVPDGPSPVVPNDTTNVIALINQVIAWVVASFNALIAGIAALFNTLVGLLVGIFHSLIKLLKHVWENYVKAAITWLYHEAQKVRAWLKRIVSPIIKRLEKIKQWYDQHILKQQLRMLQMIQTLRRILGILRLFHIKWASTLDNALADLQTRIEQTIAIVRGTLNQIINTLALVLDPTLLLKGNILGGSLLGNLKAVRGIFGLGDGRIISASEQATIDKQHSLYFASTVKSHLQTLNATGPTQDDQDNRKAARQALADETNTPLPF